jgi:hypothetical protein
MVAPLEKDITLLMMSSIELAVHQLHIEQQFNSVFIDLLSAAASGQLQSQHKCKQQQQEDKHKDKTKKEKNVVYT